MSDDTFLIIGSIQLVELARWLQDRGHVGAFSHPHPSFFADVDWPPDVARLTGLLIRRLDQPHAVPIMVVNGDLMRYDEETGFITVERP